MHRRNILIYTIIFFFIWFFLINYCFLFFIDIIMVSHKINFSSGHIFPTNNLKLSFARFRMCARHVKTLQATKWGVWIQQNAGNMTLTPILLYQGCCGSVSRNVWYKPSCCSCLACEVCEIITIIRNIIYSSRLNDLLCFTFCII